MLGILFFFITAFFLGRLLLKLFLISFSEVFNVFASLVLGVVTVTLIFFASGHLLPFTQAVLLAELVVLFVFSLVGLRSHLGTVRKELKSVWQYRKKLSRVEKVFIVLVSFLIVWLFSRAIITDSSGALIAGDRLVWTDWPLHIGMASSFAWGNNFPPQNPTFAGITLIYPFFSDFLSGAFMALGASIPLAFAAPGIVLTLLFCALFVGFASKLMLKPGGVGIGLIALLLSLFWGGIGFVYWVSESFTEHGLVLDKLLHPIREYSFWGEKGFWFFTFLFSEILPQRAFLFGLPIFFLVLIALFYGWQRRDSRLFIVAGVLAGISPFFHTHTFLSLWILSSSFLVISCLFVIARSVVTKQSLITRLIRFARNDGKFLAAYFVPFALLSFIQLPVFMGSAHTISFEFGWMKEAENFFVFWFKNTGLFLPLMLLGIWKGKFSAWIKIFGLASLSLFIIPNLFRFAPWGYDNLKMFTYWYLLGSIFAAGGLAWIASKKPLGIILSVLLFVSLTLTGVVEVSRLFDINRTQIRLWGSEDQQLAAQIKEKTNPQGVFLTAAIHDHPVVSLAGRKIVIGYPGNSWSWGIKGWDTRERDVHEMYKGGEKSVALWKKYSIEYIMVGDRERYFEPKLNEAFIMGNAQVLIEQGNTRVYKIN